MIDVKDYAEQVHLRSKYQEPEKVLYAGDNSLAHETCRRVLEDLTRKGKKPTFDYFNSSDDVERLHSLLDVWRPEPEQTELLELVNFALHETRLPKQRLPFPTIRPLKVSHIQQSAIHHISASAIAIVTTPDLQGELSNTPDIYRYGGPNIRLDTRRICEIIGRKAQPGEAVVTRSYHLPARYLIHVVEPDLSDPDDYAGNQYRLADCYRTIMRVVEQMSFARTCIPILGAKQVGTTHAVQVAVESLWSPTSRFYRVALCASDKTQFTLAKELLKQFERSREKESAP